jgi:4-amino-4-deoxy-L-arabinose transferase-like glycosyltransferase
MKHFLPKQPIFYGLILLFLVAACFRFYNLNWGAPFYFHPDERNVASSVSQLRFPENMNPHFFAYGSLPIYLIYGVGLLTQPYQTVTPEPTQVLFENAIVISRFFSALLGMGILAMLYRIGTQLHTRTAGLLALVFGVLSTGLIQFAHFGTFEMWLTFFSLLLFAVCLRVLSLFSIRNILLLGLVSGILVAIKVSSLALLPLSFLTLLLAIHKQHLSHMTRIKRFLTRYAMFLAAVCMVMFAAGVLYLLTNPYVVIDTKSFKGSMEYESGVALGTILVFYTAEFFDTIPGIYQFVHVYPFLLNPIMTILFVPALCYIIYKAVRKRSAPLILAVLFFAILLLSQIFLFVKWTRYLVPTLPFIYLFLSIGVADFLQLAKRSHDRLVKLFSVFALSWVITICTIFALSFFISAYGEPDIRVSASHWAKASIPADATLISEVYDMGITPFNPYFTTISLFNFYDLDNNSDESNLQTLAAAMEKHDYVVLPSQRIMKTRLMDQKRFPNGHIFYTQLFADQTKYEKIYETPCSMFCRIAYLQDPVFALEGTANLFDRPTLYIFKKL